jgi:hypothetical protein
MRQRVYGQRDWVQKYIQRGRIKCDQEADEIFHHFFTTGTRLCLISPNTAERKLLKTLING